MHNQQDLDAELFAKLLIKALLRASRVKTELLDASDNFTPALAIRIRVGFSLCSFLLEHVDILFAKLITDLIFLLVTVLDHLFIG